MSKTHNYFFPIVNVPWKKESLIDSVTRSGTAVALDIDDTLADFMGAVRAKFGPPAKGTANQWSLEKQYPDVQWPEELRNPDFVLNLEPFREGIAIAAEIGSKLPMAYLSARPPELSFLTARWLNQHHFTAAPVICAGKELKKGLLRSGMFSVIIDDSPSAMKIAREIKATRYCIARPWNEDEQRRFSLQEVYDEMRSL